MDLLFSRYKDVNYILNMPFLDGIQIIDKALEKKEESKAWDMWLMKYQHMGKDDFIPFSEFYKKAITPQVTSKRTKEEVLNEVYEIRKKLTQKEGEK